MKCLVEICPCRRTSWAQQCSHPVPAEGSPWGSPVTSCTHFSFIGCLGTGWWEFGVGALYLARKLWHPCHLVLPKLSLTFQGNVTYLSLCG